MPPARHGPTLPYRLLGAVVPLSHGWLVASGRLQGATLAPQTPVIYDRFTDILDERPSYEILTMCLPIGLPDARVPGGRTCDREARRLLGMPRAGAILSPPTRQELAAFIAGRPVSGNPVLLFLLPRLVEVYEEMQPYRQRSIFEVNPELSYHQLGDDHPLQHPKRTPQGHQERRALLSARMQGVETILEARLKGVRMHHLLDVTVALWTARRIAAHAVIRMPEVPEWDSEGLRMELMR